QLYESIERPKDAALQFQLAARLALGEHPPLPAAAVPGSLGAAGSAPLASTFAAASAGAGIATAPGGAKAAALDAGSSAGDGSSAALSTEGGIVPAVARPDRQNLHDRLPAAGAALTAPPPPAASDASAPVDFQTDAGDEFGLVGRKE
ncbi:MAG: hypothetical protein H0T52_02065, partial [Lautropia sp.]|nr:hypothetical protein [Lautropia sp.]